MLIWGDNKYIMSSLLPKFAGKIKLIYIDPPFATGTGGFDVKVNIGDLSWIKDPSVIEERAYRDTWGKGLSSYLQMLYERLVLMKNLLSDDGSIYVHLDHRVVHYVKMIMDEIFGKDHLINEIIWYYKTGGRSRNFFFQINMIRSFFTRRGKLLFLMLIRLEDHGVKLRDIT